VEEPRDAAVNFYIYVSNFTTALAVSLPQHGFRAGLCLQTAVNQRTSQIAYI